MPYFFFSLKEIQEKHLEDSCLLKFEERTAAELVAMKLGTEQDCVEHEKHLLELKDNLLAKQKSHDKADAELKEKLEQITKDVLQKREQVNRQKEQKKDLKMVTQFLLLILSNQFCFSRNSVP